MPAYFGIGIGNRCFGGISFKSLELLGIEIGIGSEVAPALDVKKPRSI